MRRLLPLAGLLALLLLAAGAALLALRGGNGTGGEPGGGPDGAGVAETVPGESGHRDREKVSAPGRVRGVIRLLAEDRPASGVAVVLSIEGIEMLRVAADGDGGFTIPGGSPRSWAPRPDSSGASRFPKNTDHTVITM